MEENRSCDLLENQTPEAEAASSAPQLQEDAVLLEDTQKELDKKKSGHAEKERELTEKEQELTEKERELEARERALDERDLRVAAAELELSEKKRQQELDWQRELLQRRNQLGADLAKEHRKGLEDLSAELMTKREEEAAAAANRWQEAQASVDKLYEAAQEKCDALMAEGRKTLEKDRQEQERKLAAREAELKEGEERLLDQQNQLKRDQDQVDRDKRQNKRLSNRLTQQKGDEDSFIESEVDERIREVLQEKDKELEDARRLLQELTGREEAVLTFTKVYGDPNDLKAKMKQLTKELADARDELKRRPSMEDREELAGLRRECKKLEKQISDLEQENQNLNRSQQDADRVRAENETLQNKVTLQETLINSLEAGTERLQQQIIRLQGPGEKAATRDERIAAILNPSGFQPLEGERLPCGRDSDGAWETQWLDMICDNCRDYGIVFPKRIVYAFHTALKIADWSTITVLSGVSGTGKSELPKLYANFGGMNFFSVPVQPSWDSQESMLGFFNSIDNCFEPEELLRFLALCTEDPQHPENAVYSDYMSIVLLDEMNLAHVEHYFARFLSELERRRGMVRGEVPSIEVKLGAGVAPYRLPLSRSILWTGTMNQDETTKSLSDKVLDRGLMIHFPRPAALAERPGMSSLNTAVRKSNRKLMTRQKWSELIVRGTNGLVGEQKKRMQEYKKIIEDINTYLEPTGRALGHRIWQSVEFYILNYPTVRMYQQENGDVSEDLKRAMKDAFEDQLVQKVMPKLRGIETRGPDKKQLDAICALLANSDFSRLTEDFKLACQLGYGQFMWGSAKYLQADEPSAPGDGAEA